MFAIAPIKPTDSAFLHSLATARHSTSHISFPSLPLLFYAHSSTNARTSTPTLLPSPHSPRHRALLAFLQLHFHQLNHQPTTQPHRAATRLTTYAAMSNSTTSMLKQMQSKAYASFGKSKNESGTQGRPWKTSFWACCTRWDLCMYTAVSALPPQGFAARCHNRTLQLLDAWKG